MKGAIVLEVILGIEVKFKTVEINLKTFQNHKIATSILVEHFKFNETSVHFQNKLKFYTLPDEIPSYNSSRQAISKPMHSNRNKPQFYVWLFGVPRMERNSQVPAYR